jgi:uncharacterized repeat protein (TIGR01451 family)
LPESIYRFAAVSVNRNGSDFVYVLGGLHNVDYRANVYHSAFPNPPTPTNTPTPSPTATPSPTPLAVVNIGLQNHPRRWVAPGEVITYTIFYHNASEQNLATVEITSTIPPNVELLPSSIQVPTGGTFTYSGSQPGATIHWDVGAVSANATGQVSYQVRRPALKPPVVPRPLAISKTGPATAAAGAPIQYTLVVTNNTAFSITNLLIADTLPEGAAFLSGSDNPQVGNSVEWTVPSLPGDSAIIRQFTVTADRTLVNSAYFVSSDEGPTAKGQAVVVTFINGTDPPPSGDGITIVNPGATVTWEVAGEIRSLESNSVYNPAFALYVPLVRR